MTRLLLIEANDNRRWVGSHVGPKVHVLPIALMGLAAHAKRANPALAVRLVETSLDAADDESLAQIIREFAPTWIGVRSISLFVDEVRRVLRVARSITDAPVLLGGPVATAWQEGVFDVFEALDYAALGEGEPIVAELVCGRPLSCIPGVLVRGKTRDPAERLPAPPSLDELAPPDYGVVDLERYASQLSYAYNQRRQGVLLTSRGCPFSCTYCFQISRTKVRLHSAERVVRDIERLYQEFGIADHYVVDDVFNLDRKRALRIFERIEQLRLPIRLYFVNGLRVDLCDREFIERMVAAGTVWVTYAIESACPRIQRFIRKELDLEHARDIIGISQRHGIVVNVNTMYGFPTETAEEAQMTLEFLGTLEHPSLLPYHFNLRGYPGCAIVEQAERAGWSRESFLATGFSSYGELPAGSPTFSRHEMMTHLLEFHERFGLANREHVRYALRTLERIGYSERELLDMYSVLNNRKIASMTELGGEVGAKETPRCSGSRRI